MEQGTGGSAEQLGATRGSRSSLLPVDLGKASAGGAVNDGVSSFLRVRPRLFGIAYRMLGNVAEAEDIVQEVWLRWHRADRAAVRDDAAFLAAAATRLAINRAKSAHARREAYLRTWLPDCVAASDDPCCGLERGEALELAVSMLLESLTPTERAGYVLREAFAYEYAQIAALLRVNEVNCRQLVTRARKHIAGGRRVPVEATDRRRLLEAFLGACRNGDLAALESLFRPTGVRLRPALGRSATAPMTAQSTSRIAEVRGLGENGNANAPADTRGNP